MRKQFSAHRRKYNYTCTWIQIDLLTNPSLDIASGIGMARVYTVLCVSCPSATEFSAISYLLFARSNSNSNSPRSLQRFRRTLRRNFNWIRQHINNFPIDPHCKYCSMGVYGEIIYPLSVMNEILHQSSSKTLKWSRWVLAWLDKK